MTGAPWTRHGSALDGGRRAGWDDRQWPRLADDVGCARSGTTVPARMVDARPQLGVAPCIHWIAGCLWSREVRRPEDPATAELGYPWAFPRPGRDARRQAARIRRLLEETR
jgi:hypothetical protein